MPEFLECPFCKSDDVRYGATVCKHCGAEIEYARTISETRHRRRIRATVAGFGGFVIGISLGFAAGNALLALAAIPLTVAAAMAVGRLYALDEDLDEASEKVIFRKAGRQRLLVGSIIDFPDS